MKEKRIIETERLYLRELEEGDYAALCRITDTFINLSRIIKPGKTTLIGFYVYKFNLWRKQIVYSLLKAYFFLSLLHILAKLSKLLLPPSILQMKISRIG